MKRQGGAGSPLEDPPPPVCGLAAPSGAAESEWRSRKAPSQRPEGAEAMAGTLLGRPCPGFAGAAALREESFSRAHVAGKNDFTFRRGAPRIRGFFVDAGGSAGRLRV